jgi:hypothetical protein
MPGKSDVDRPTTNNFFIYLQHHGPLTIKPVYLLPQPLAVPGIPAAGFGPVGDGISACAPLCDISRGYPAMSLMSVPRASAPQRDLVRLLAVSIYVISHPASSAISTRDDQGSVIVLSAAMRS